MRIINVSCFSVHFCSQLSPISCLGEYLFAYVAHICEILYLCAAVCGRQFLSRVDILMQVYDYFWEPFMGMSCFYGGCWHVGEVFPGKGLGPGFSLSGRPSALDRTLFERGRRIFCMHFYRVSWQWGDFWMHFYRVCWNPLMGMSCFLVQNCTRIIKVSCFSVHVCFQPSKIWCFEFIFLVRA